MRTLQQHEGYGGSRAHPVAIPNGSSGFMSGRDKALLDDLVRTGGGGGASVSVSRVSVTVASATQEYTANVVDAAALVGDKVQATLTWLSDDDENGLEELDEMDVFGVAKAGSVDFTLTHRRGPFVGAFLITYSRAA